MYVHHRLKLVFYQNDGMQYGTAMLSKLPNLHTSVIVQVLWRLFKCQ